MSFIKKSLLAAERKKVFVDACPINVQLSEGESDVVVMSGDNATGKSLICRHFENLAEDEGIYCLQVSMGDRNSKGYMHQVKNYSRYGDEDRESTGHLTINRIIKDIEKLKLLGRPFMLILDEPDMGLSESYLSALGQYLQRESLELRATGYLKGFLLISHSRKLISSFVNQESTEPNVVLTGSKSSDFWTWFFKDAEDKSIDDLLSIPKRAKETRLRVSEYIKKT